MSSTAEISAYMFTRTSSPQEFGEKTQIISPYLTSSCMMFYYRMLGSSVSCIVVSSLGVRSNLKKLLWLKSGKEEIHWTPAQINIPETEMYRVSCFLLNQFGKNRQCVWTRFFLLGIEGLEIYAHV